MKEKKVIKGNPLLELAARMTGHKLSDLEADYQAFLEKSEIDPEKLDEETK